MRERLAAAFVLLALAVLLVAGAVRAYAVVDLVRDQEASHLRHETRLVAGMIERQVATGGTVDRDLLAGLVSPQTRLRFVDRTGTATVVDGEGFSDADGVLTSRVESPAGSVELTTEDTNVSDVYTEQLWSLLTLILLVTLLAGLAGWWAAGWLAAPFRGLADTAAALGRGRFDLRPPATSIPEAREIGQALRESASQLERRLSRERDFAEHASHELRTPLTSLRLELEDLTMRADVPDDVKEAAGRCIDRVDSVNAAAGQLVALSREGSLVEGGQLPLSELATQVTQAWADRLAGARRTVTANADGDLDQLFTPGPVEQVLELVLDDVARGHGSVRLGFVGDGTFLRIIVPAGSAGAAPLRGVAAGTELAHSYGGRVRGDLVGSDLELLMPRR